MENSNLNFVKPAWIYAINDRQKMLPYQPYTVVPWTASYPDQDTVGEAIEMFFFFLLIQFTFITAINQL